MQYVERGTYGSVSSLCNITNMVWFSSGLNSLTVIRASISEVCPRIINRFVIVMCLVDVGIAVLALGKFNVIHIYRTSNIIYYCMT